VGVVLGLPSVSSGLMLGGVFLVFYGTASYWSNFSDIVRVPHVYKEDKDHARIEFRLPDAACNPYLSFAAILNAGIFGIENKLTMDKKWQSTIPRSLYEAIKVAENSNFLKDSIGIEAYNSILENKEKEWIEQNSVITDYERDYYMKFL